jgi:ABC-type bacteriocin/lantibiotic exporter with double-glycine peptidase domain
MKKAFCLLLFFAVLTGCVGKIASRNQSTANIRMIQDVPFYEDTNHQCGPSSLASVMNYWQSRRPSLITVTPQGISSAVYSEGARGTLGIDLEFYARKNGFQTMQYSGSIEDLRNKILNDVPVIILVDFGAFFYQRNHYMVVSGYSNKGIIAHSGREEKIISFDELGRIWGKTRFWTLIVKPSD